MQVQITNTNSLNANNSTYKTVEMMCEGKSASVMIVSGGINYVSVIVNNAAHRAYRGLGRQFENFSEALSAYSSPEVRSMIQAAQNLEA